MDLDLTGHVALVTGGGRRLGRAFAEGIAACGGGVVIHYGGSRAEAEAVVKAIQDRGGRAAAVQADLGQPEQTAALIPAAAQALGDLDLLVNSAAIFEPGALPDLTLESWNRHLAINLTAPLLLCQAFARQRAGRPGAIVNILDWRALRPGADHLAYTLSKAGLEALTRSLAVSLAPAIRVNGLALGAILPPSDGGGADVISRVPLGRWGTVEEAVDSLIFLLAGPGFITGEVLVLDGGRLLA
jgi:NAD(P)-dependent dehydrogenase (short-subunit alcohol dehydrogenase family)